MPKHLVIVESPAKAKTINKFLGKDYKVKASMGHIRDLIKSKLGVDVENGFAPHYVNSRDKTKVIRELRDAAKKVDDVILALDPDREGEAIAWHLREILSKEIPDEDKYSRVTYNQITKAAIQKAFSEPGKINMGKVNAQQARRVLDRLVGYKVSPLLWRRIRGGSSAGRVQTVALRLICEREKEIRAFKPQKYWIIGARVSRVEEPRDPFEVRLLKVDGKKGEIEDQALARELLNDLEQCRLLVKSIKKKKVKRNPKPPFITSTLQQAASSAYGYQPKQTMSIAQKLYEGVDLGSGEGPTGLITYMRTDSVYIAEEAIDEARELVERIFGTDYLPGKPNRYRSRSSAQEAHEAVRPTDISRTPDSLKGLLSDSELKLYSLIWKRTIACQMNPARIEQVSVDVTADSKNHDYLFRASASKVIFPGYMAAWGRGLDEEEDEAEGSLPPLSEEDLLDVLEWLPEEKETQPPKRFSEAALIKALEENGVGRPSTYASIISTLYSREYVVRENKSLMPTDSGMEVNDFLVSRLPDLFEVKFTAHMEEELDEIEGGNIEWTDMMGQFYKRLEEWIEIAKTHHINHGELEMLIGLAGEINNFNPPTRVNKKIYNDETFVQEIKEAYETKDEITERQVEHLRRIVARYHEQISNLTDEKIKDLNLNETIEKEMENNRPPDETTFLKLEMLNGLSFAPPRKVGKKTYSDEDFARSLREQVESGKRLSDNQVHYLDRLVLKYAEQIEDFDRKAEEAGISREPEEDNESGPLIEMLSHIKEFKEPTKRGNRTWDDSEFASSLRSHFETKKALTPRQRGALKKLLAKYHEQIPVYDEMRESLNLPVPGAHKGRGRKN